MIASRSVRRVLSYFPFAIACAAIWWVSSHERPPLPSSLGFRGSDKLLHACAYAVLAALACLDAWRAPTTQRHARFVTAFLLASVYGIIDEVHQSSVPGRDASVGDALADALGAALGVWLTKRAREARPTTTPDGT